MGTGIAVVVAMLAAIAWIGWPEPDKSGPSDLMKQQTAQALKELQGRESYEQASGEYLAMLTQIRAVLDEQAPDLEWTRNEAREIGRGQCDWPARDVSNAEEGVFDVGEARGAIPEQVWAEVEQQVIEVAAAHGFAGVSLRRNEPESRKLVIRDSGEGTVELETAVNTTLGVYGSCLLSGKSQ